MNYTNSAVPASGSPAPPIRAIVEEAGVTLMEADELLLRIAILLFGEDGIPPMPKSDTSCMQQDLMLIGARAGHISETVRYIAERLGM